VNGVDGRDTLICEVQWEDRVTGNGMRVIVRVSVSPADIVKITRGADLPVLAPFPVAKQATASASRIERPCLPKRFGNTAPIFRSVLVPAAERRLSITIVAVWCADRRTTWEDEMAERKSALKRAPDRPELTRLLERAKTIPVTDDMLQDQRTSFVFGNAPKDSRITKDSALKASKSIRVTGVVT